MSINSVLNYSPFLSLPYAGTEEGLASNVFCENLSMLKGYNAGVADGADPPVAITLNVSDTGTVGDVLETAAVPAVAGTGSGTGMTAKFSVVAVNGADATRVITIRIENPGVGYKLNDAIQFDGPTVLAAFDNTTNITPNAAFSGAGTPPIVFTLVADGVSDAVVIGYSADDNTTEGWQFLLDAVAAPAISQRIVISAPSRKASSSSIANLERTTTVYANATSTDNAAVPDSALGGACCTALSNNNGSTHINVTVVRFVPTGFTLNDCAMTVRVGDRQLATTE